MVLSLDWFIGLLIGAKNFWQQSKRKNKSDGATLANVKVFMLHRRAPGECRWRMPRGRTRRVPIRPEPNSVLYDHAGVTEAMNVMSTGSHMEAEART